MNNEVRQSKIYTYFHGAGNVFQQFIIVVGILAILMGFVAAEGKIQKVRNARENYRELAEIAENLQEECDDIYWDYRYDFSMTRYEEIEVSKGDEYYEEKTAYNEAVKAYNEAQEKATKAYEKYESTSSESIAQVLLSLAGGIAIVVGVLWSILKKFSYNKESCEQAYDEEIQIRIEEAKVKALEKLNIVAEQIDKVEPVVLNGVATYDSSLDKNPVGKLSVLFQAILKLLASIEFIILGGIAAAIYFGISMIMAAISIVPIIGAIVISVILGIKIYNKYERDSYVNPRTIKKLENMYPSLFVKVGTDYNIRVSLPAITVYMFGDEQIYMYYQYFDIVTGKIFCEGIHEYFYEDIVGVVSAQETKKVFMRSGFLKLSIKAIDYLKESITVVSSGCQHSESYIVPMGSSLLDTSFVGMRNLIRQKKSDNE